MKLPSYPTTKQSFLIGYIDFEEVKNVVRGGPFKFEVTKLPNYIGRMCIFFGKEKLDFHNYRP